MLRMEVVYRVLEEWGVTRERLLFGLVYAVVTLLLLFGFIFVGIAAFTEASSFASVINALLPVLSGTALGAGGREVKRSAHALEAAAKDALRSMA